MQFYNSGAVNAVSLYSCNVLRDNFLNNVCLHIGLSYRHSLLPFLKILLRSAVVFSGLVLGILKCQ